MGILVSKRLVDYATNIKSFLQEPMLVLGKHGPKYLFYIKIGLLKSLKNQLSSKKLGGRKRNPKLWQFLTNIRTLLMTLFIFQIYSPQIGREELMKGYAMCPDL